MQNFLVQPAMEYHPRFVFLKIRINIVHNY